MKKGRLKQSLINFILFTLLLSSLIPPSFAFQEIEYNLTYDANGNLIQGFGNYFEYNGFNQLSKVKENNATGRLLADYLYDHEGNRIRAREYKVDGSNETTYYWDKEFVQVINSSGTYNFTYFYDKDVLIAEKDHLGRKFFYHPDHLGSTTLITNESGAVVENVHYLPYGTPLENSDKRFLYTGKEKDKATNLYYYGARYYDPFFRRFTQPDQNIPNIYNPQDLNRYSYVRNNPYKYVDPDGEFAVYAGGSGKVGIGIGVSGAKGIALSLSFSEGFQVGFYTRKGTGIITPTAGLSAEFGVAPLQKSLKDFSGRAYEIGADVGELVSLGGGISIPTNDKGLQFSKGSFGIAIGIGDINPLIPPASGQVITTDTSIDYIYGGYKIKDSKLESQQTMISEDRGINVPTRSDRLIEKRSQNKDIVTKDIQKKSRLKLPKIWGDK